MRTMQTILGCGYFRRLPGSPALHAGLILAATAWLAGCASAPAKSQSMIDDQANFDEYKTFGWLAPASADGGNAPASIVDTRIRAAITTEMQRKAYVAAPAGVTADLLLDYEAARTDKVKSNPFRIGIGVGSFGGGVGGSVSTSTSSIKNVSEGSLVIYAVDSARNAEVWRSRVSRELGKDAVSSEVIQSVVREVLSDFPTRTVTQ
ncbi:MAG TPA: DUF4136 domain-containing protein [Woeseiaceae bacterium]|nr:DUF4136 domain-containing protein [Woeseiaceae bacterium]